MAGDGAALTQGEPLLAVRDLVVRYGQVEALHGLSLEVFPGEIVAVIGSNGAGKSTTLRAISGMIRPAGGRVLFAGRDITGLPSRCRPGARRPRSARRRLVLRTWPTPSVRPWRPRMSRCTSAA